MSGMLLAIARFCMAAWVGVGLFFVTAVLSLRNPELFPAAALNNHPRVLFPLFYAFEFWLLGIALGCGLAARRHPAAGRAFRIGMSLLALAMLVAFIDYLAVYRPLAAMLDMPQRPESFATYHGLSRWINGANLLQCAAAACLLLAPTPNESLRRSGQFGNSGF